MFMKTEQLPISSKSLDILAHYFSDARVFIYGSCARTLSEKRNDVDLVVVSAGFSGVVGVKRRELVIRILGAHTVQIDPICLTPNEFERLSGSESLYALLLKESLSEITGMIKYGQ